MRRLESAQNILTNLSTVADLFLKTGMHLISWKVVWRSTTVITSNHCRGDPTSRVYHRTAS